jgi:predicted Zn-dependent protease
MLTRRSALAILIAAACFSRAGALSAPSRARQVSPELAKLLSRAQDDLRQARPAEALRRLRGYRGSDHALRQLLIGHAHGQRSDHQAAATAYGAALRMDPKLTEAGVGLAQALARQDKWAKAAELLGRFVAADSCDADTLLLYAQVARRLNDGRLSAMLVRMGVRRFPADQRFRRLDLAVCLDRRDHRRALEAVAILLKAAPAEADLWQHRAFACDRAGRQTDSLAALEASLLCEPNDVARHRRFVAGLLAAGDWSATITHGQVLLAGPFAKTAAADVALMDLLIRAADMGEQDKTLAQWLARMPAASRTPAIHVAEARRALRLGEVADARTALRRLIEQGEADAGVFLWAGHLAEQAKDWPEAETLYDHARRQEGSPARLAALYLARLHLRRGRVDEAGRLLRAHLNAHPEDSSARALLAVVDARRATQ